MRPKGPSYEAIITAELHNGDGARASDTIVVSAAALGFDIDAGSETDGGAP